MNALFLTPIEISKAIRDISKTKAAARKSVLFLSGILAGMYIAFGACAAIAVLSGGLTAAGAVAVNIAETKIQLGFTEALCRGILCNMLVCLAVIMCISSKTVAGKIFGIYFPIMAFVASGFEHSIANMYFLPVGLMIKGEFISNFFTMFNNLIPVTLGNIIGGLSIVLLHPKTREKITHIFRKKSEKY